jgi:hypothetical protein
VNAIERRAHAWPVLPDFHPMPKGTEMAGKTLSGAFFHCAVIIQNTRIR